MASRGRDTEDRQPGGQVKRASFAQQDDFQAIQGIIATTNQLQQNQNGQNLAWYGISYKPYVRP